MKEFDWFIKWSEYSPEKVAVVEDENEITYAQLNALASDFSGVLHRDYGLEKGDRIAILSAFSIELIALFGAAQKAGYILVPINTRLTPREVEFQIEDSKAKLVLSEPAFCEKLVENKNTQIGFADLRKKAEPYLSSLEENDPIFILYTSGTTGFPKGAIYTHKMLFWNSVNTALRLDLTSDDVTLNCMPAFHTGGWNVLITPLLHRGGTIWLQNDFVAEEVMEKLESSGSTLFMAVPTMLKMMVDTEAFKTADLSNIRYFIVGGEALPIPMIELWSEKNIPIRQGYGLTEVGPNVTSLHQTDTIRKRGSIGFYNFYVKGKIVNDSGTECATDEVGELWLGGPNVTPGYWNNEEANQKSFSEGWFKTGDLVRQDSEGYIYVAGRKKEMYISGGENVYPREVEKVLQDHPAVADVAVVGVPDEKWGESGAAFIVLKPNESPTQDKLKSYCLKNLAKFKIPKYFFFENELPINATGKIDKKKLSKSIKHKNQ
ncbi:MAG: AMP-binding protein [Cryomorphaceae bacterium]